MSVIKLTANFELPGSTMFGNQTCQKSLKECTEYNSLIIEDKVEKGKKTEVKREKIKFFTRKSIPALQVINISDEAYQYMISTEVPSFSTKSVWNKMNKEQKLIAHLNEIASNLGGKLIDYTVYPD